MCSLLEDALSVGELAYRLQWLNQQLMQNILQFMVYVKKLFSWKVYMLNCRKAHLALIYFKIVKVSYIPQKIKCFMREQSTLMSSIIMSDK
jgi:hypothetical protein